MSHARQGECLELLSQEPTPHARRRSFTFLAEDGGFPTQSQRFRKWVETSDPDLAAWVDERHRKAVA